MNARLSEPFDRAMHGQFGGREVPKPLPYSHHGFQLYPPGHCRPRHLHFLSKQQPTGCRYRLELSDDPGGLRPLVPSHPGFPSETHGGFPPCCHPPAWHTFDNPLPPVDRTDYRFFYLAGSALALGANRGEGAPCPRRPTSFGVLLNRIRLSKTGTVARAEGGDWVEQGGFTPERPLQPDEPD
ncbi:hypothetical protein GDI3895 (plasmid) [Gluconacetobacter diazotrophicus PA1 5]|uniref:Uncharacterized protein n=1 Tax=Gluconacetobacter diazotrophicus (strain ATCC 49037 / DSM 5601 / CCUG 37298 / CIP 103539 / LMG 7603 / PAl5) TaxID=272568 RepID=A9HT47_GLUDA|nr:hypothetical protein GDI3895 [Gluconacetobacter diazotrophicus PA1 5]